MEQARSLAVNLTKNSELRIPYNITGSKANQHGYIWINQKIIGFEGIQFSDNMVAQASQPHVMSTSPAPAKVQIPLAAVDPLKR